ncbi:recombinase family protein [Francisellaceae bacterium]|nr:recombinase family protein [Francisellaceae bacterium]
MNSLINIEVRVIAIKQKLDITVHDMSLKLMVTMFSLFSELERDLISSRTREALASKKAQGMKLGKPKSTIQKSKLDKDFDCGVVALLISLANRFVKKYEGYF